MKVKLVVSDDVMEAERCKKLFNRTGREGESGGRDGKPMKKRSQAALQKKCQGQQDGRFEVDPDGKLDLPMEKKEGCRV